MSDNFTNGDSQIETITAQIEIAIYELLKSVVLEQYQVTHYGANHIHPKHLVYLICVNTDSEKQRLLADKDLIKKLRDILAVYNYPVEGRDDVHIGF